MSLEAGRRDEYNVVELSYLAQVSAKHSSSLANRPHRGPWIPISGPAQPVKLIILRPMSGPAYSD